MTDNSQNNTALANFFLDAKNKRAANAYLLTGPKALVSEEHARTFLLNLFCEKGYGCKECRACKKVMSNNFIDIEYLKPEGQSIKINAIRSLNEFLVKKPIESNHRAVVIKRAELMTPQAQNCLLKPLEEPRKNTVFILLARSLESILPTVVSRCRVVKLKPQGKNIIAKIIKEEFGVSTLRAELIASLSGGYVSEAKRLNNDDGFFSLRDSVFSLLDKIITSKTMAVSAHVDFLEQNKLNIQTIINIMALYIRDVLVYKKTGDTLCIANTDRKNEIKRHSAHFTTGALSTIIDILFETEKKLNFSVNFKLCMENMLFLILEVKDK